MPDEKDNREEIIDKMRRIAQNIRSRDIEGIVIGVKYKNKNEDGQGCFIMSGNAISNMAMSGKILNMVLDKLFETHKDDPKSVIGMFLQALVEGEGIKNKIEDADQAKIDAAKKIDDAVKDIRIDDDLRKKLGDKDVPGLDDLLNGK